MKYNRMQKRKEHGSRGAREAKKEKAKAKGKGKLNKTKDYNYITMRRNSHAMCSSHVVNEASCLSLILYLSHLSSMMKIAFQLLKEGCMFSKIRLFLDIQMAHDPSITISIANGTLNLLTESWIASHMDVGVSLFGHIKSQHLAAKGHSRNR